MRATCAAGAAVSVTQAKSVGVVVAVLELRFFQVQPAKQAAPRCAKPSPTMPRQAICPIRNCRQPTNGKGNGNVRIRR